MTVTWLGTNARKALRATEADRPAPSTHLGAMSGRTKGSWVPHGHSEDRRNEEFIPAGLCRRSPQIGGHDNCADHRGMNRAVIAPFTGADWYRLAQRARRERASVDGTV